MNGNRRQFIRLSGGVAIATLGTGCGDPLTTHDSSVPESPYHAQSTAEEVTQDIDLSNKLAVVTGCTSGIGFETMRVLAKRGAYVVGTGRTLEKAKKACNSVAGVTTPLAMELTDFESIVACADAIRRIKAPIDIIICNAGMRGGDHEVVNGVEKHFQVNHLGHFLFVNRLIDRMFFAWQGRVVIIGSRAAYQSAPSAGIEFGNIDGGRDYSVSKAYAHSKLANALFSLELSRQLRGTRITANALHPGVINTGIVRRESFLVRAAFGALTAVSGKTLEEGAATPCFVATHPSLGSVSGKYFEDCNAVTVTGNHHLNNSEMAAKLWTLSESLLGDYLIRHERPDYEEFQESLKKWL